MFPMVIYHLKITILVFAFSTFANHKHDLRKTIYFNGWGSPDACNLIINLETDFVWWRVCAEKGELVGKGAETIVFLSN